MPKTMDVRAAHYEEYIEGKDRPRWDPDVLRARYERWKAETNDYVDLEFRVSSVLSDNDVPRVFRPQYYSFARRIYKMDKNGEAKKAIEAEVQKWVALGLDVNVVNKILEVLNIRVGAPRGARAR